MYSDQLFPIDHDPSDFDDYDDGGDSDDLDFDCRMDRNGDCGAAGSEECEFECPYNRN